MQSVYNLQGHLLDRMTGEEVQLFMDPIFLGIWSL